MPNKILVASLPIDGVWDAVDASYQVAKAIRVHNPSFSNQDVVQFPLVDGGRGTIDFIVTHTLGSFLEVEATGANGEDVVVPLGFAGEDGKLAVIEMQRTAGVPNAGDRGTTYGIGELILDALDEGAFSILLGHEEPLAADAGLGAAAALGVKFYDAKENLLDLKKGEYQLNKIARVDPSGRSFGLLSARFYIATSTNSNEGAASPELLNDLNKLKSILQDVGIVASTDNLSASAIEFGLSAFLSAERHDGSKLLLEASQIEASIATQEFASLIIVGLDAGMVNHPAYERLLEIVAKHKLPVTMLTVTKADAKPSKKYRVVSLADAPLFQAPLTASASTDEKRRDFSMRLEKIAPQLLSSKSEAVRA